VPGRGLFADNPGGDVFSQHMNALAVLYDVATPDEGRGILDRIVAPGRGIDAPEGMFTSSYYFAWYLAQAFVHVGEGDRYLGLLDTWRDLLKLNFTTWPEERGDTRSDSHAWSAHPTADLLGIVAGIGPGKAGYRSLRVAPSLGNLTRLDATAATPAVAAPRKNPRRDAGSRPVFWLSCMLTPGVAGPDERRETRPPLQILDQQQPVSNLNSPCVPWPQASMSKACASTSPNARVKTASAA